MVDAGTGKALTEEEADPVPLAWVPYADRAEAERRLGGIPAGLELDFYRADGDDFPGTIDEVAFYVLPYMRGPAVLERAAEMPKLEVVQTLTAGYEEFLPLVPSGVTLCNAAGLHDTSTAELAVALALASGRHLDEFARNQADRAWKFAFGQALADQRVLIVGYGRIGQAIERRLDGFEVASVTRVARRARPGPPRGAPGRGTAQLLPEADVVFLIAPHTPQTEGLIGARELALLPDGALLVNVARGKLVDTDALVAELATGRIRRGAGRDRPGAAARRSPALAAARGADLPPRRELAFFPRADRLMARSWPASRPASRWRTSSSRRRASRGLGGRAA
jgi:lactate dehydrogenase-like 2-hydroxyacid dehydrogenase